MLHIPQTFYPWHSVFQQRQDSIIIFWIFAQYTKSKTIWGFLWMQMILELEFGQLPSIPSSCCPSFPLTPVWPLLLPPWTLSGMNPVSGVHQPHSLQPKPEEPSSSMRKLPGMCSSSPSIKPWWWATCCLSSAERAKHHCGRTHRNLLWHIIAALVRLQLAIPTSWVKHLLSSDYC